MSDEQSNIAIVQDLYASLSKGDTAHVQEALLDDQVLLQVSGSHHSHAREHTGSQDTASYVPFVQSLASDVTIEPETIAAAGDQVFAVLHIQGHRTDAPSRALDVREVQVFTLANGKITQVTNYSGDQQAKDEFFA
ncbi:MAG TPA: nuclear transport factor 2 family protein [Actinocrinis sp.]|nr:nuclear transport factor 2 family protein [Actinocrinis sp.]